MWHILIRAMDGAVLNICFFVVWYHFIKKNHHATNYLELLVCSNVFKLKEIHEGQIILLQSFCWLNFTEGQANVTVNTCMALNTMQLCIAFNAMQLPKPIMIIPDSASDFLRCVTETSPKHVSAVLHGEYAAKLFLMSGCRVQIVQDRKSDTNMA